MTHTDKHLPLYKIAAITIQSHLDNLKSTLLMTLYPTDFKYTNLWILQRDLQITIKYCLLDFSTNKTFILTSKKFTKTESMMNMQTSTQTKKITINCTILLNIKKGISKTWRQNILNKARTITTVKELTTKQAISLKCTISLFILKTRKSESI